MCIFPTYRTIYSPDDKCHKLVKTSCGKCPQCLSIKRAEWLTRLYIELENSTSCHFLTLTYNNENLPIEDGKPGFSKTDVQKFFKRLRKYLTVHYGISKLRYFLASEYGGQFGRPHYHAILFNLPDLDIYKLNEIISKSWSNGFTSLSPVTSARINYVCKYMLQNIQKRKDFNRESEAPFMLCSRNPAIGSSYLTTSNIIHHLQQRDYNAFIHGQKTILPRYLRRKIFDNYPDIKNEISQKLIEKSTEKYVKALENDSQYTQLHETIRRNNKQCIQNFYKRTKKQFGSIVKPEHLELYLKS